MYLDACRFSHFQKDGSAVLEALVNEKQVTLIVGENVLNNPKGDCFQLGEGFSPREREEFALSCGLYNHPTQYRLLVSAICTARSQKQ